jgi:pimeloyl-[acyl-carrier protein] methyl ester esterase
MTAALHIESVGAGPPLVLLHGLGLNAGFFTPVLAPLARRMRVHAVDLPGHGASAPIDPYTLDTVVDALDAALAPLGEPLTVLGWSFGGTVAQRYAARHPARIARLVLVCTTPRIIAAPDWPHGIAEQDLRRFADELAVAYAPTMRRFLTLQLASAQDARAMLKSMRMLLSARAAPEPGALAAALAILVASDLRAAAPTLPQPTLVVGGGRDMLTPAGASAWLAATIPDARLTLLADAAHIPFLSHTAPFMAALDAFLDDHAAR